jgi:hypothetical protein
VVPWQAGRQTKQQDLAKQNKNTQYWHAFLAITKIVHSSSLQFEQKKKKMAT